MIILSGRDSARRQLCTGRFLAIEAVFVASGLLLIVLSLALRNQPQSQRSAGLVFGAFLIAGALFRLAYVALRIYAPPDDEERRRLNAPPREAIVPETELPPPAYTPLPRPEKY